MSVERRNLTFILFMFFFLLYMLAHDIFRESFGYPDAVITCWFQSIVENDHSDEFKRGCYLSHGFLIEAKKNG